MPAPTGEESRLLGDKDRVVNEDEALIAPVESSAQSSTVSRSKMGIAVLLASLALGAVALGFSSSVSIGDALKSTNLMQYQKFVTQKLGDDSSVAAKSTTTGAARSKDAAPITKASPAKKSVKNLRKNMKMSKNKELKPGEHLMSLAEASSENEFNECQSMYSHDSSYLHVAVEKGCISLFNNDISKYSISTMITFCGCEMIGPKQYDFVALQNAGLVSKSGAGLISFIATGESTSVTLYNEPDFTGEKHTVIGPNTQVAGDRIVMGTEENWDNNIYSIVLQAWNSCEEEEEIVCSPITTQAPVPSPTLSPFIQPTPSPSNAPIIKPTAKPSEAPTVEPTNHPRARPTMEPLAAPTLRPTQDPTKAPLAVPSRYPTSHPNAEPSHYPTEAPVNVDPTLMPTVAPSMDPRLVICKGKAAAESKIVVGKTYPHNGCASFFWSSLADSGTSMVSTICSCGELGETEVPESLMEDVGLVDQQGFPTISAIISGNMTSLTIYAPYWSNLGTPEEVKGVDKYVVGPREASDLTAIERKSGSGLWNDKVKSISLMAWNECTQHLFEDSCIDF